jgi:integrase
MAKRPTKRLDAPTVRAIVKPGRHADGDGLYLIVDPSGVEGQAGAKRWLFMFRWQGKLKEMGLGGLNAVSLAKARQKAAEARALLADGINPIEARRAAAEVPTFGAMADDLIALVERESRNAKHVAGWKLTLTTHAAPIRAMKVNAIGTEDVLGVLRPLAEDRQETASRLRGRIERVLDAAKAKGYRQGENPARWRGHLEHFLAKRQKLARGHHAALPFAEAPAFVADLRDREAMAALALEFLMLTATRTGEVIGARWSEIDLGAKVWTIPAARMKAGREHRVPLSARAVQILEKALESRIGDHVFPGPAKAKVKDRPLSTNAFRALLIRALGTDKPPITPHGFRSSFRDWCGEASNFPRELAEQALAHAVGDAVEQAYRRGDALEKRRLLMDAWAAYLARGDMRPSNVTQFVAA